MLQLSRVGRSGVVWRCIRLDPGTRRALTGGGLAIRIIVNRVPAPRKLARRIRSLFAATDGPTREPTGTVRREVAAESRPEGGGVECFDTDAALALNQARIMHLGSLDLPLNGHTVLEVGAGVGHLTALLVDRGCVVVATEARAENLAELRRRLPTVDARQADVEEDLHHLGRFDFVFCYGVLYHLESPLRALRNMEAVCNDLLLIETMVSDAELPVLRLEDETKSVNQALRGLAHRPSPSYLATALNRVGFDHVYAATDPPDHPDYQFSWLDNMDTTRNGSLLRGVFVASRSPLRHHALTSLLR